MSTLLTAISLLLVLILVLFAFMGLDGSCLRSCVGTG